MKMSTLQMIAMVCILAVGFLTVSPFVPEASAARTHGFVISIWYEYWDGSTYCGSSFGGVHTYTYTHSGHTGTVTHYGNATVQIQTTC